MLRESPHVSLSGAGRDWPGKEPLNRALVAGLLLEVIFSPPNLPEDPQARRCQVKSRLKNTLVSRLAGHIPLNSFRDLAQNLDQWFDFFYPLISPPCSLAIMIGKTGTCRGPLSQSVRICFGTPWTN